MNGPNRYHAPKESADHSTMELFIFSFSCDRCGIEWRSAPYDFNPGSFAAPIEPVVYQILWRDQHKAAYERARRDASFAFNRCPICGRWVCDACFYLAKVGISDLCQDCMVKLARKAGPANSRSVALHAAGLSRAPIRRVGAGKR